MRCVFDACAVWSVLLISECALRRGWRDVVAVSHFVFSSRFVCVSAALLLLSLALLRLLQNLFGSVHFDSDYFRHRPVSFFFRFWIDCEFGSLLFRPAPRRFSHSPPPSSLSLHFIHWWFIQNRVHPIMLSSISNPVSMHWTAWSICTLLFSSCFHIFSSRRLPNRIF